MRACKIALVDSSSSVARLLVEPQERSVAAAVDQSACYLLPLRHPHQGLDTKKQLRLKAPPCTDACFLRLEASKPGAAAPQQQQQQQQAELQFGQFQSENDLGRSFFLVASPGSGGDCTDIRAWSCESLRQVQLEAGVLGLHREGSSGVFARFDIPPAGLKMVASVNVLVIYSPSALKLWVFGVKAQVKAGKHSLLLLNCSLVECGGDVSSMHAASQHLVMSGGFGVRVLPLRPLLKGRKSCQIVSVDKFVRGSPLNGLHDKEKPKNGFLCEHKPGDDDDVHGGDESQKQGRNGVIKQQQANLVYCHAESSAQSFVEIHALGDKAFLLLDSAGVLHALTLKKPPPLKRFSSSEVSVALELDLKTFSLPFHVSALALVPSCTTDSGATRTLWIADGKNSIYVVSVSEEMLAVDGKIVPPVMQVLFTGSRIDSIFAVSPETVLALSEGTVVAYVKAGS